MPKIYAAKRSEERVPNKLLWICPRCGWMTPRSEQTSAEEVGDCPACYGAPWNTPTKGEFPLRRGALVVTTIGDGTKLLVPRITEGE